MERQKSIREIAIAVFVVCLLFCPTTFASPSYTANYNLSSTHTFGHYILAYAPNFLLGITKRQTPDHFLHKLSSLKRNLKSKSDKIAIFTGRGANKNHAIFEILDANGPLPISALQKLLNKQSGLEVTYYASLNKRIHALEKGGYIAQTRPVALRQNSFKAALYEVRAKFYLARFLSKTSHEEILSKITDTQAIIILAELINAIISTKES